MWNTLKFFFVWFWLGLATFVVGVFLLGLAHPGAAQTASPWQSLQSPAPDAVLVLVAPLFMSIPAYFIARPKSQHPA